MGLRKESLLKVVVVVVVVVVFGLLKESLVKGFP